jgi:hypothetical protein
VGQWDLEKLENNETTETSFAVARNLSAVSSALLKNAGIVL